VVLKYPLDHPEDVRDAVSLGPGAHMEEPPKGSLFAFPNIPIVGPFFTHTMLLPVGEKIVDGMYEQAFWPDPAPDAYVDTMKALYLRPANFTATAGELAVMQESLRRDQPQIGQE